ncbi:MAG: cyclic nucleotide-binding/CBS domain-containing protein [Candidatus Hodarchaeota archaeon]
MTYPANSANIRVKDIMTIEVISIDGEETVLKAVGLMTEKDISSLLVRKGDKEVGIITEKDILTKVIAKGVIPSEIKVEDVMSAPLIVIEAKAGIEDAAKKMREKKIRRLPVIREGKIIGIITETDITKIEPELIFLEREHARLSLSHIVIEEEKGESIKEGPIYDPPLHIISDFCDNCGNFSDDLTYVDGNWLCDLCLDK